MIVEWEKKATPETAVSHGVQETVAGRRQKEVDPHKKPSKARQGLPEPDGHQSANKEGGEYQ
jgi:hypothetical protein